MFEAHNPKFWEAYDKKCWFYMPGKLSYFALKHDQGTGSEFWSEVCGFKFVYASSFSAAKEKFWVIKKMSSDSEWSSFTELSSTSEEDTLDEEEEDIQEIYGLNFRILGHWNIPHHILLPRSVVRSRLQTPRRI